MAKGATKEIKTSGNKKTLTSAKAFLRGLIQNNRALQEKGLSPVALGLEGEAGIGKTSVVTQVAKEEELACVKLNLAQLEDLGDLVGMPIREIKLSDGRWVPEATLSNLSPDSEELKNVTITNEIRTGYAKPAWLTANEGKKGGILLLDDYTRAQPHFIQACMEIIDRQEYYSWKLPKGWTVVLTTNPDNGEYIVRSQDNAMKTRFANIEVVWDFEGWATWAEGTVNNACINFLGMNQELLTNPGTKINPRSLDIFFRMIHHIDSFTDRNISIVNEAARVSVGEDVAAAFTVFIQNRMHEMPNFSQLLRDSVDKKSLEGSRSIAEHKSKELVRELQKTVKLFQKDANDSARASLQPKVGIMMFRLALAIINAYDNGGFNGKKETAGKDWDEFVSTFVESLAKIASGSEKNEDLDGIITVERVNSFISKLVQASSSFNNLNALPAVQRIRSRAS